MVAKSLYNKVKNEFRLILNKGRGQCVICELQYFWG